ncbi:PGAP1-like alpha/beta domain-containing protein [Mobiluncus mulieris]|uniref:GPI inositol-deacylase PGAP1-like alpha/beta domain-containing protein n=1 Tax=Mobiluncus mulieris TaxID=2052 RepID=A0ABD4TVL6_9ACTO|nr:hypothetical protein [Mobiluncus mulieris]MCU9967886.1 hypothetical protein [Mobiluncus mulieris]MCU9973277.1 hypothetical protein [Mobiluncus mulieris]MCV0009597.1 hypothetical protein [Mobiluncus mulieris]NMW74242.1 hypothetical protein [Mobiluncus mulieris]NMX18803.1 hypothetical protein [Mobiluncus mulieris]
MRAGNGREYSGEYLFSGGNTALCVDTEQVKAMVSGLEDATEQIGGLAGYLASQRAGLEARYLARMNALSAAAAAGDENAGLAMARLSAAWGQYTNLSSVAEYGENGVLRLGAENRKLAVLLRRATGLYELSETQVLQLMAPSAVEGSLLMLAEKLVKDIGFPPVFTLGGKRYYAKDMNEGQKAAVFLSWLQAKLGEKQYGKSQSVTLRFAGGRQRIEVLGFEDSPELDKYFGVYLRTGDMKSWDFIQDMKDAAWRTAHQEFWKERLGNQIQLETSLGGLELVAANLGLMELREVVRGKTPQDLQVSMIVAGLSQFLASRQEKSRRQKERDFAKSKTARAIGVAASERLALKQLRVEGGAVLVENPDGSISRGLPRDVGDIFRYAQTIDPKEGAAFEIQQWETATGQRGARVVLRGTDSWDAGSIQPQDMLTNTEAVAGLPTGIHLAVMQALQRAGVGSDTPVELVGHSQAGIIASNLAADPRVRKKFNIRNVITAGSPVANAKIPQSIQVLNLYNNADVVPITEGMRNRPSSTHLTVQGKYTTTMDIGKNHSAENTYAPMADDLQGKHYAKYEHYLECRDKVMGLDQRIVKATTQRFELNRDLESLKPLEKSH